MKGSKGQRGIKRTVINPVSVGGRIIQEETMGGGVWGDGTQRIVQVWEVPCNPARLGFMGEDLKEEGVVGGGNIRCVFFIEKDIVMGKTKV